ncbi:MAG: hemerythrin domain-containing protein [Myxococcota bacterium]
MRHVIVGTDRDGITLQHRKLEGFLDGFATALEEQDRHACETMAFRLEGAMRAHFDVEEQVIFPSVTGEDPELTPEIEKLVSDHHELRRRLEEMSMSVATAEAGVVQHALTDFRRALGRHEHIEEALLARARERKNGSGG